MAEPIRLFSNVALNFVSQVWFVALPLVTSPYIVHRLGIDAYGVLSLATTVVGYLAVLDLGIGTATIKYLAEHYSQRNDRAISKVVGTSLVIYALLGLLGTVLILSTAGFLIRRVLHVPADMTSLTVVVFYISSFGFLVNMPLTVFNAIPNALQRFDILVRLNLLFGTATILGQVLLLSLGYSLKALVSWNVGLSMLGAITFVFVSKRLLPGVSLRPAFDPATARQIARFSAAKVVSVISGQIVFQLDKLLIAAFLPIANLSYYVIPMALAQRMLSVIPNVTTAVFPAVAELQDDQVRLHDLYLRVSKSVVALIVPIAAILFTTADKILGLWMGSDFALQGTGTLQCLAIGFLVASFSAVPAVFLEGLGKPELPALFGAISAVLNLVLAVIFIPRWGILGAACAVLGNAALQVPVFVHVATRKIMPGRTIELLRVSFLRPFLAGGGVFACCLVGSRYVRNLFELCVLLVVSGSVYLCLSFLIGVLDPVEKRLLRQYFSTLTRGRPHAP